MIDIALIKSNLPENGIIREVYYFDELDSTNNYASSLKDEYGVLVISEFQRAGKGRLGRTWESEKGLNLTFSIKKKFDIPFSQNAAVTFYFTYFVYSVIKELLAKDHPSLNTNELHIKWPNDILFEDKKLCGLLIESKNNGKDFIIGIGLNVNQEVFENELNAVSLKEITGTEIELNSLLLRLISKIDKNSFMLENAEYDKIFELWKNSTKLIGKTCEFTVDGSLPKRGIIKDLLSDGAICILENNKEKKYYSGDIRLTRFAASKASHNHKIT